MSKIEANKSLETVNYIEPDPDSLVGILRADEWGREVLQKVGFRIKIIEVDEIIFEPRQTGVHRYPPVIVEVERAPEEIASYINMERNLWIRRDNPEEVADSNETHA